MHPVIPKVRVGDILVGTKNLRNWLQTASLLGYVSGLAKLHYRDPKSNSLYIPTKRDQFVVAVNAWETFAVWGLDQDLVVLFCNPVVPQPGRRIPVPRGVAQPRPKPSEPVMNPALFAQWFIRTRGKRPDLLNTWPDHAYSLWASLQMNAISNPQQALNYSVAPDPDTPFTTPLHNATPKGPVRERVQQAIHYGLIRSRHRRRQPVGGRAYGPHLQDIPRWRKQIREITANPRIVKKIKEDVALDVPKGVYEMVIDNQ